MNRGIKIMFLAALGGILLNSLWSAVPAISGFVHDVLDPSAGKLLGWNTLWGMFIILIILNFITSLLQKYTTNQVELKKLRDEQKLMQAEMQKFKDHPEKIAELTKKNFEFLPKTMDLTAGTILYTFVPFILLFRWFLDYFSLPALIGFKFFGFLPWFWFYLIFSIVISSIIRKYMKIY